MQVAVVAKRVRQSTNLPLPDVMSETVSSEVAVKMW